MLVQVCRYLLFNWKDFLQVAMSFLLDILPTDVLIIVWLSDCVKDLCALDVAIANNELRMRYILTGCLTNKKKKVSQRDFI